MNWTKQQQEAIDARNCSVIVSAAAGSGKTAVLTERLSQLLADENSGVRADRIAIVTFTRAAAAEMKKRLDVKLRDRIALDPSDQHLLRQQTLLQSARICTINAFCFDLLRDNITDQGITASFTPLDGTDDLTLRQQAMDELLQWYNDNRYEDISRLYDKLCINGESSLTGAIRLMDSFLSSEAVRSMWLDKAAQEYQKPFEESVYFTDLLSVCRRKLNSLLAKIDDYTAVIPLIFAKGTNEPVCGKFLESAAKEYEAVSDISATLARGELPGEDILSREIFGRLPAIKKTVNFSEAYKNLFTKKRDGVKKEVRELVSLISSAGENFTETADVALLLIDAVRRYQDILWQHKCERNAISFDDGERLVLDLLISFDSEGRIVPSETAKRISEQFDIIMIDEYQDSNNKQDLIFKLISRNFRHAPDGAPMYGDNAFLVGDVKQSIYGFRLANPENFRRTLAVSVPYSEEEKSPNQKIFLNQNFRSSQEVIAFVNYFFSLIMGNVYDENERLKFGASYYGEPDTSRRTTFNIFADADETDNPDEPYEDTSDADLDKEAEYTAEIISTMLDSGSPVTLTDGKVRPCKPSDFAILVRKNKNAAKFVNALERRGISSRGTEEKGYLKATEIAILLDLLRVISNPLLDIPMAAVLTSPMFMFTVDDISYLRSFGLHRKYFSLLTDAAEGKLDGFANLDLASRCRSFLDTLEQFRLSSITMTVSQLITSIYDTTDFIAVTQQMKDGEKKRANLRAMIHHAVSYETSASFEGGGSLGGFIRYIDRILEVGDFDQSKIAAAEGDYVIVETIHKSKGLEYPFVFIGETRASFNMTSEHIMFGEGGRMGMRLYDHKNVRSYKTFQHYLLSADCRQQIVEEEMRLLYVAMTRAKQQLFINLDYQGTAVKETQRLIEQCCISNSSAADIIYGAKNYAAWLWLALMLHSDFAEIMSELDPDVPLPAHDFEEKLFTWRIFTDIASVKELSQEGEKVCQPDMELVAQLRRIMTSPYDRTLSEMPAKLSVTEITRKLSRELPTDLKLGTPEFMTGGKKLTGADRGTAIHTFFQYCDMNEAKADPSAEVERVRQKGYLNQAQADSIDVSRIRAFFASNLYRRMSSLPPEKVRRERKFMAALSDLDISGEKIDVLRRSDAMIKGIIDLMFEEDEGITIVDYKSDVNISANALKEKYTMQLMLYKAAVEKITGKKVRECCLYSIALGKEIVIYKG